MREGVPFVASIRGTSFANPTAYGVLAVGGDSVFVRLDSLRVGMYNDDGWSKLAMRTVLVRKGAIADTSPTESISRVRASDANGDGKFLVRTPDPAAFSVAGGLQRTDRLGFQFFGQSVIDGGSASVFAYLDSTAVRRVLEQDSVRRNRGGS